MYDSIKWSTDIVSAKIYYDYNNRKSAYMSVIRPLENGYYETHASVYKNGSHRTKIHRWIFILNPVAILNTCSRCGKTSIARKVHQRWLPGLWAMEMKEHGKDFLINYDAMVEKHTMCTGCWNFWRTISKRYEQSEDLRLFINRVKRDLRNEQKTRNDGATARVPC